MARETVRLVPASAGARSNLGAALLAFGALREAEAEFDTALGLEPDHAFAKTGRPLSACARAVWNRPGTTMRRGWTPSVPNRNTRSPC